MPQVEKEERTSSLNRFVKLDVWAMDAEGVIYDAEAQNQNTGNLPKRSRLYQGIIDSKLLPPGVVSFNQLNPVFIIMIMPFDLFGKARYRYTFTMRCEEESDLALEDGATRIFLNTHGKNKEEVSPELVELLNYMEHTNDEEGKNCESAKIQDMQSRIEAIKSNEEIGVRFMQRWEELVMEREAGHEAGREEGLRLGEVSGKREKMKELVQKKLQKGKSVIVISEELEEEEATIREIVKEIENMGSESVN